MSPRQLRIGSRRRRIAEKCSHASIAASRETSPPTPSRLRLESKLRCGGSLSPARRGEVAQAVARSEGGAALVAVPVRRIEFQSACRQVALPRADVLCAEALAAAQTGLERELCAAVVGAAV